MKHSTAFQREIQRTKIKEQDVLFKSRTAFKMSVTTVPLSRTQVDCITTETSSELAAWPSGCGGGFAIPPREEELLWLQGKAPCLISSTQFVGLGEKPSFHLESHEGIFKELAIVLLLAKARVCVQNKKDEVHFCNLC